MARKQTRMQLKRDIEANWKKATNFTPLLGEVVIYEPDETHIIPRLKIGNGETNVNDLPFLSSASVSTIGKGSFGSGISSGIAGESFNVPVLGNITIDDMSNFKVATATSAGASSIQFKIGGSAASMYYKYLETLLNNGYNGGLLVIKGMVLPALTYTLSTTGSLIKSYYITIQLMDGYTTTVDLTTSDYPTNLYAGVAYGEASQAFGTATFAFADNSHTEGNLTRTLGDASHAEGYLTSAESVAAHAEGSSAVASGDGSHAEGGRTKAIGDYSHAEGGTSEASGMYSHAEGSNTHATNTSAHAEGSGTYATAANSHAEGMGTHAEGEYSHAEGANSYATKSFSHAEGHASQATGSSSHAEGNHTIASGDGSHAEGNSSIASGSGAHAGGGSSIASGAISFAHGSAPQALGSFSVAFGNQTVAASANAFVVGKFNEAVKQITDDSGNITQAASDKGAIFVVGNGSGEDGTVDSNGNPYSRSDAFRVFYNGTAELPTATTAEIDGRGNKAVPTVEWVKAYHAANDKSGITGNYIPYIASSADSDGKISYDISNGTNGSDSGVRIGGIIKPQDPDQVANKYYVDFELYHQLNTLNNNLTSQIDTKVNIKTRNEAIDPLAYQYNDESIPYLYGRYGASNADGTYTETEGLIKGSIGGIKELIREQIDKDFASDADTAAQYHKNIDSGLIPDDYRYMLDVHTIPIRDGNCAIPVGMHIWKEDEQGELIEGTDELWYGAAAPAQWVQHSVQYGKLVPIGRGFNNPNHDGVRGWDTGLQQNFDDKYTGILIREKNPNAATLIDEFNAEILTNTGLTRLNADAQQNLGALGLYTASFGGCSSAQGKRAFAEGTNTVAIGKYSHAEGDNSVTLGNESHAEGYATTAYGAASHAEGNNTQAIGAASHAEGISTIAEGIASHAEGISTIAEGIASHASGAGSQALKDYSAAFGNQTRAAANNQFVIGKFNKIIEEPINEEDSALFIIGNGDDDNNRNNAFEVYKDGSMKVGNNYLYTNLDCSSNKISFNYENDGTNGTPEDTYIFLQSLQAGISSSTPGGTSSITIYGDRSAGMAGIAITSDADIHINPTASYSAKAYYNDSEIATMDNLIQSGTILPDAADPSAPKFFVLI